MIRLYQHQEKALNALKAGSILCGGVGSGKSITALYYFLEKVCLFDLRNERLAEPKPIDLFIITTAKKRDSGEWEKECANVGLSPGFPENSLGSIFVTIDSWNRIKKYESTENAFFIFDEQRLIGSGAWVKSFLKISRKNRWILLTATPGDSWLDFIPVFLANNFYKNRTTFLREHVVFNAFTKFPKVERYLNVDKLVAFKESIITYMSYEKKAKIKKIYLNVDYEEALYKKVLKDQWDIYKDEPIRNAAVLCYVLRRISNSDLSRLSAIESLLDGPHPKAIIFYNFNYELDILRSLSTPTRQVSEHNGHRHDPLPKGEEWVYLVQYASGSEGWNCITTNTVIFYSQNYSYKTMLQAAGRIDRINTLYDTLYYYTLKSSSPIDQAISYALKNKKIFNENDFAVSRGKHML